MKYTIKLDKIEKIRNIYKLKMFCDELGFTMGYISRIFTGKREIPKSTAFAIAKCIDKDAVISDYFDEVN